MNPVAQLLNVISPAHRQRAAQTKAACAKAMASCELLPQFISCADRTGGFGLLNVTNGCFIKVTDGLEPSLLLSWSRPVDGQGGQGGHMFFLEEEAQIVRFVAAMQLQSRIPFATQPEFNPGRNAS